MKDLKLRAWDKESKIYIYLIGFIDDTYTNTFRIWWRDKENIVLNSSFPRDRIILELYTGLKDKNGKEIYEGDILSSQNDSPGYDICDYKDYENLIVKWNNKHFCFDGMPDIDENSVYNLKFIEVIGNIHEYQNL